MIEINIQTKEYAWIAVLSAKIKGKEHKKELKGIFEKEEEIKEIIFSNLKSIKNLMFYTNNEKIESILELSGFETKLNKTITFDFSEIIEYKEIEDPTLPDFLNKGVNDICIFETKEENQIATSTYFVKAYLYFKENEDKVKEIKLLKELKSKGIYDKEILMEDILQIIEETLLI